MSSNQAVYRDFHAGPGTGDAGDGGAVYETVPVKVRASRQRIVSATVMLGDGAAKTACPGDWVVRWEDGTLEVYEDADFRKKFRPPHECLASIVHAPGQGTPS